eukprot:TRINITY_DN26557_c0_g1_i3.p1 TRINITY_DN26557_c0_g1~~TRINITY_DN26557_c0_g1_i3.p1  ORF type:complete len:173 (+),score=72.76 TRINITY_DN26557_c0_g1_i3:63-581(+)
MWFSLVLQFFFFSSRRRHTRCREVSWARRCVQETGINAEYMGRKRRKPKKKARIAKFGIVNEPDKVKARVERFKGTEAKGQQEKKEERQKRFTIPDKEAIKREERMKKFGSVSSQSNNCLLYTSDAADDTPCVDLGGRRIIKKKKKKKKWHQTTAITKKRQQRMLKRDKIHQ